MFIESGPAFPEDIQAWFRNGLGQGATHFLLMRDTVEGTSFRFTCSRISVWQWWLESRRDLVSKKSGLPRSLILRHTALTRSPQAGTRARRVVHVANPAPPGPRVDRDRRRDGGVSVAGRAVVVRAVVVCASDAADESACGDGCGFGRSAGQDRLGAS